MPVYAVKKLLNLVINQDESGQTHIFTWYKAPRNYISPIFCVEGGVTSFDLNMVLTGYVDADYARDSVTEVM